MNETRQIMQNFPEALKEPILRKIQFSQISRLDALVDDVYNSLRHDFFPGEVAIARIKDQRIKVIVREKAKFNSITLPSGETRPAYSRLRVQMVANPSQELAVDDSQLTRDRKVFTKVILRTFIKHAVSREAYAGAPWIVKDDYAKAYKIDQSVPWHLQRSKQEPIDLTENQNMFVSTSGPPKKERQKPGPKPKNPPVVDPVRPIFHHHQFQTGSFSSPASGQQAVPGLQIHFENGSANTPLQLQPMGEYQTPHHAPPPQPQLQGGTSGSPPMSASPGASHQTTPPVPGRKRGKPGPERALPIDTRPKIDEDLNVPYSVKAAAKRYPLKLERSLTPEENAIMGTILEVWVFLNVYHEPLILDTFTFDDFIDGLKFASEDTECSLIDEIHCALLASIVGKDKAQLLVTLPIDESDEEEENEEEDDSENNKEKQANGHRKVNGMKKEEEEEEENADDEMVKGEQEEEGVKDGGANDGDKKIKKDEDEEMTEAADEDEKKEGEPEEKKDEGEEEMKEEEEEEKKEEEEKEEEEKEEEEKEEEEKEEEEKEEEEKEEEEKEEEKEEENGKKEDGKAPKKASKPHRADEFTRYQNTDWTERLRKRMFRDGGWQQILTGLLNTVSYVEDWHELCEDSLKKLASRERAVTLGSALTGYYELTFTQKIGILNILCNLLHSSPMVRGYIDRCLDQSTKIRREKNDKQREYKVLVETLKGYEEEKKTFFPNGYGVDEHGGKPGETPAQTRRRLRKEKEAALAKEDAAFRKVYQEGQDTSKKIDELNDAIKKHEEELMKLDCQRMRMLGKDRYHNRYWWFENNGMVRVDKEEQELSLKKDLERKEKQNNSNTNEENGETEGSGDDDKNNRIEDEKSKSEPAEDTSEQNKDGDEEAEGDNEEEEEEENNTTGYTMGRLWIQGPLDEEAEQYLGYNKDNDLEPQIQRNETGDVWINGEMVINPQGQVLRGLAPIERKKLEEGDVFLKGLENWGYYDEPEEIEGLLKWLNKGGRRELKLTKEIDSVKDRIFLSMRSRKEDLEADAAMRKQEIDGLVEDEEEEFQKRRPSEYVEVGPENDDDEVEEEDSDDIVPRKRRRSGRRSSGKKKQLVKKEEDPQVKEDRKQQSRERIQEQMSTQMPQRVLEWTNSLAIETLGHTHYESQKKRGPKKGSRRT
ncbi:hypothetical protein TRICI_003655 [Trichomonascus ciferrii]|uniref:Uncharacterized protein n=1 Tax=Trichomonascus ciferrii TaxID=44093 RepID=A0A642V3F1_9ASCO|nr:hypothetical protein TRICI_003655 [Trichomonascus ciferrii]